MRLCSVPGCEGEHAAKGYCRYHYNAWYLKGDATIPKKKYKPRIPLGLNCTVEGCIRKYMAAGLCGYHYHLKRRRGAIVQTRSYIRKAAK